MSGQSHQRLTVWAGKAKVAMSSALVAEVIRAPRVTRLPGGPPSLLGLAHLRGKVLPVVSLGRLLGRDPGAADRVVVLRREPTVGLAVDRVEALKAVGDEGQSLVEGQLLLDDADGARWLDLVAALEAQFAVAGGASRMAGPNKAVKGEAAAIVRDLAHLSFELAGQAYALPLEAVLEVASVPAEILALPRTDEVLIGVAQRREAVLPILSTRALLGLPDPVLGGDERLVVTRVGDQTLGLVVDRISVILRTAPERLRPAPSLFNRGEGEARIDAVLRLPDGKSLVSVLSPDRLLADERVTRLLPGRSDLQETDVAQASAMGARERFVVMRLGREQYALPVALVDGVIRMPPTLTRLPKSPAYVLGVINVRGRVTPIIDLRQRFGVEGVDAAPGRVVMITLGGLQAGFAVDTVASILEVDEDELLPAPRLGDDIARVFDRTVERDGEVVLLVDPQTLLDRAEADLLADLAEKTPAS